MTENIFCQCGETNDINKSQRWGENFNKVDSRKNGEGREEVDTMILGRSSEDISVNRNKRMRQ